MEDSNIRLGHSSTLSLFSPRWGHSDDYTLTKILNGWLIVIQATQEYITPSGGETNHQSLDAVLSNNLINIPENISIDLQRIWEDHTLGILSNDELDSKLSTLASNINAHNQNM